MADVGKAQAGRNSSRRRHLRLREMTTTNDDTRGIIVVITSMRIAVILILCCTSAAFAAADLPDFDRDVRPILQQHCFSCHGPDKQKGGLRLDQKTVVLNGGDSEEPTVVPGNVAKSALIKRLTTKDADEVMPPKGDRLAAEQVAVLQKWIETGAHWIDPTKPTEEAPSSDAEVAITEKDRSFWSFQP